MHESMTHPMLTQQRQCLNSCPAVPKASPCPCLLETTATPEGCLAGNCVGRQPSPPLDSAGRALQDIHNRGAQRLQVDAHLQRHRQPHEQQTRGNPRQQHQANSVGGCCAMRLKRLNTKAGGPTCCHTSQASFTTQHHPQRQSPTRSRSIIPHPTLTSLSRPRCLSSCSSAAPLLSLFRATPRDRSASRNQQQPRTPSRDWGKEGKRDEGVEAVGLSGCSGCWSREWVTVLHQVPGPVPT